MSLIRNYKSSSDEGEASKRKSGVLGDDLSKQIDQLLNESDDDDDLEEFKRLFKPRSSIMIPKMNKHEMRDALRVEKAYTVLTDYIPESYQTYSKAVNRAHRRLINTKFTKSCVKMLVVLYKWIRLFLGYVAITLIGIANCWQLYCEYSHRFTYVTDYYITTCYRDKGNWKQASNIPESSDSSDNEPPAKNNAPSVSSRVSSGSSKSSDRRKPTTFGNAVIDYGTAEEIPKEEPKGFFQRWF